MEKLSKISLLIFFIINISIVHCEPNWNQYSPSSGSASDELGHFDSNGLEEFETVPVQDPSSDAASQANLIGMPSRNTNNYLSPFSLPSSSSDTSNNNLLDNNIHLIPSDEMISSAIEAAELRRAYNNRRRRQPKNSFGKFVFPIRYTRKPRFRSSHSALVSGVDSGYGDLANVLASHYGLEKPNKVLRYGIS